MIVNTNAISNINEGLSGNGVLYYFINDATGNPVQGEAGCLLNFVGLCVGVVGMDAQFVYYPLNPSRHSELYFRFNANGWRDWYVINMTTV